MPPERLYTMHTLSYPDTPYLIALTAATSAVATYMVIHLLDHSIISPRRRITWRAAAASMLGIGIWLQAGINCASYNWNLTSAIARHPHIHCNGLVMLWSLLLGIVGSYPFVTWISASRTSTVRLFLSALWLNALLLAVQSLTSLSMNSPSARVLLNYDAILHAYLLSFIGIYAALWVLTLRRSYLSEQRERWRIGAALLLGAAMTEAHFGSGTAIHVILAASPRGVVGTAILRQGHTLRLEVLTGVLGLGIMALISGSAERRLAANARAWCEQSQRYRSLFEHNPDAVFELDVQGRFVTGNAACEALFGKTLSELSNQSMVSWMAHSERDTAARALALAQTGEPQIYESMIASRADAVVFTRITHIPIIMEGVVTGVYTVAKDISEPKKAALALQRSESALTTAHRTARLGTWSRSLATQTIHCSPETLAIIGLTDQGEFTRLDQFVAMVHPDDRTSLLSSIARSEAQGSAYSHDYRIIRGDGSVRHVRSNGALIHRESETESEMVGTIQDITDLVQLQLTEQRLSEIVEASQALIATSDVHGRLIYLNRAGRDMLSLAPEQDVTDRTVADFMTQEALTRTSEILPVATIRGAWHGEAELIAASGDTIPVMGSVQAHKTPDGAVRYFSYIMRDISDERQMASQLQFQAYHDGLTHLPNRAMFDEILESTLQECARKGWMTAVIFIDLDEFKRINDSLGHSVGDLILREIAERLYKCAATHEVVARWGGDEFTVLIPRIDGAAAAKERTAAFLSTIFAPIHVAKHNFYITASIGYSVFPDDGSDATTLVKHADTAMYVAKEQGKNQAARYAESMSTRAVERLVLESDMRGAMENGELQVFYQPQIDAGSGALDGMEALLRWHHKTLGWVSPAEFIPLMEQTGLIITVGEWVLREACGQTERWRQTYGSAPQVAVNVSARQIDLPNFIDTVQRALADTGLPAHLLELEITEGTVMRNEEHVIATLRTLREMGVRIALDDFGIGYSSLTYLTRYPLDTLKIDRSFVRNAIKKQDHAAVIEATIFLAHSLRLRIVAEGVETAAQLAFLRARQCDKVQGFLLSPPTPAAQLETILETATANMEQGNANAPASMRAARPSRARLRK